MKAGFIGYRNFAEKLRILFEDSGLVKSFLFFHPQKTIEGRPSSTRLEDLFDCDFIVIASPDRTHGEYLRQLQDYGGYIFCEKIPVVSREDLAFLKSHQNPLLYFNFNYRKGYLYNLFREQEHKILYISHKMGHGLALKEEYKNNWRSNASYAPLGVFQLSGIHFFDLLVFCFGRPKSYHITARNISPYGDSIDNFGICLEFQNGLTSDMFFSYTSAYQFKVDMVTTEQLIECNGRELLIRGPRETYDRDGLFVTPPVISQINLNLYADSLKNSVNCFLDTVMSRGEFSDALSENNLLSTELFLDILDNVKTANVA